MYLSPVGVACSDVPAEASLFSLSTVPLFCMHTLYYSSLLHYMSYIQSIYTKSFWVSLYVSFGGVNNQLQDSICISISQGHLPNFLGWYVAELSGTFAGALCFTLRRTDSRRKITPHWYFYISKPSALAARPHADQQRNSEVKKVRRLEQAPSSSTYCSRGSCIHNYVYCRAGMKILFLIYL